MLGKDLPLERLIISAGFVGATFQVLDDTLRHVKEREQFGRALGSFQAVAHPLVDLYTRAEAIRLLVYRGGELHDAGSRTRRRPPWRRSPSAELYADATRAGDAAARRLRVHHRASADHALRRLGDRRGGGWGTQVQRNIVARQLGLGRSDGMAWHVEGIKVLDAASMLAGPYAATLLGDLGAEVIKLEPPARRRDAPDGAAQGDDSGVFVGVNRNKRSIAVDLPPRTGGSARRAARMGRRRRRQPSAAGQQSLGLDFESVHATNPRAVSVSVSTFGPTARTPGRPASTRWRRPLAA